VLFDAFDQVTGVSAKFVAPNIGKGGGIVAKTGNPAAHAARLAKPTRPSEPRCWSRLGSRSEVPRANARGAGLQPSCPQAKACGMLHGKLKDKSGRVGKLAADARPVDDKVREIYLWVYARPPSAEELQTMERYLQSGGKPSGSLRWQWRVESGEWCVFHCPLTTLHSPLATASGRCRHRRRTAWRAEPRERPGCGPSQFETYDPKPDDLIGEPPSVRTRVGSGLSDLTDSPMSIGNGNDGPPATQW